MTDPRHDRQHYNFDGRPKLAYHVEADALRRASEMNEERRAGPATRGLAWVEAYQCRRCHAWHVGVPHRMMRHPVMRDELGERAWWNLYAENVGALPRRERAIAGRWRGRAKRLLVAS